MTTCRGPKRTVTRVQPASPLIAVSVAPGCPCSGGVDIPGYQPVLDVQRAGDDDADIIRYPIYDYTDAGDPRFFLDFQVLNTPGVYNVFVRSTPVFERGAETDCGQFQMIVGPSCSIASVYLAMPASDSGTSGRAASGFDQDMYPSEFPD